MIKWPWTNRPANQLGMERFVKLSNDRFLSWPLYERDKRHDPAGFLLITKAKGGILGSVLFQKQTFQVPSGETLYRYVGPTSLYDEVGHVVLQTRWEQE